MATVGTLVEIIDGNKLLLKRATRGISKGKCNGLGGKVNEGEAPEECAIREVLEESGLSIRNPFYHGIINFHDFGSEEITWEGHIYSAGEFDGKIKESEEGELRWFNINELPWKSMWKGDKYWLPLLIEKEKFDADLYFDKDNEEVLKHYIRIR